MFENIKHISGIARGQRLLAKGEYNDAYEIFEWVFEETQSKRNLYYAYAISGMGSILKVQEQYQDALACFLKALAVFEEWTGYPQKENTIGITCDNISVLYTHLMDYASALKYSQRAITVFERNNATQYLGNCYSNMGTILKMQEQYQDALECFLKALAVFEQLTGYPQKENSIGMTCDSISVLYKHLMDYASALKYSERAITIFERNNATQYLGNCYNNLMCLYYEMGDIQKAVDVYALADKYYKVIDKQHTFGDPEISKKQNLAVVLNSNPYKMDDAMRRAYQVLGIHEGAETTDEVALQLITSKLFRSYFLLNEYEKALKFAMQALDLSKKNNGEQHPETAEAYINAADCYNRIDEERYPNSGVKALYYGHKAVDILNDYPKKDYLKLFYAYHFLSTTYGAGAHFEEAIEYAQKAFDVAKNGLSNDHDYIRLSFRLFASIYFVQGKYQKAFEYSEKQLKIAPSLALTDNLNFSGDFWQTAILALLCDKPQVVTYTKELMSQLIKAPAAILKLPQEHLRLGYLREMKNEVSFCYSIALSHMDEFDPRLLYDFALKTSNIDNEISYAHSQFFRLQATPDIRDAKAIADSLRQERAKLLTEGIVTEAVLAALNGKIEIAEIELLKLLDNVEIEDSFSTAFAEDVQAALKEDEAVLEYGRFTWYADKESYVNHRVHDCYYAFLITRDAIKLVALDGSAEIDTLVLDIIKWIGKEGNCDAQLASAYERLISSFSKALSGKAKLYIVPDSTLYKLPFELLIDKNGVSLNERFSSITYLSSGRELLRNASKSASDGGISIIANPQFDLNDIDLSAEDDENSINDPHSRSVDTGNYLRAENIASLPFTEVEAIEVAPLWGKNAVVTTGAKATKHSLFESPTADVLHISTHGFAYEPQKSEDVIAELRGSLDRGKRLQSAEDPLLRCGLLFSGASNWLRGENLPAVFGDGILSGNDLLSLDLSQYRVLVLSACQTGLGDTQSGEGVKGLRRAFELAGVGTMVCTLWSVDDFASALLMKKFYEELLKDPDFGIAAALSKAKAFVRNVDGKQLLEMGWQEYIIKLHTLGYLTQGKENYATYMMTQEKPLSHPRYWAGFVVQGYCGGRNKAGVTESSPERKSQTKKSHLPPEFMS